MVSHKWEKLSWQLYRIDKTNNNINVGATKFIRYDIIDKILSHIAKANGVHSAMDQIKFI